MRMNHKYEELLSLKGMSHRYEGLLVEHRKVEAC